MEKFITIESHAQAEIVEKKSKFIANMFYIDSIEEAENIIKETRKKYFDARHNCVAYRVLEKGKIVEKASDDGEPSGTAGGPMLNILQNNNFVNVLVIVTRYFGGILLGTGGLVRAYSDCLQKAIEKSKKVEIYEGTVLEVTLDYNYFESFKYYCRNNDIDIIKSDYSEIVTCNIVAKEEKIKGLLKDYEAKNTNIKNIKELYKKYIKKSI